MSESGPVELANIPPVELAGVTIYEMSDGSVTEAWWYFDMMGLLSQLGLVPEALPA